MPIVDKYSIRFDQRNAGNTAYSEAFVSGSNLIITTDVYGNITGSNTVENAVTASYALNGIITGSTYPTTSSWATNSLTASSINFTASDAIFSQTSSLSILAQTASYYAGSVISASYSLTASFAPVNTNITSSWAHSASNAISTQTASSLVVENNYNVNNLTASNINVVATSSLNVVTANTASFIYFSLTNSGSVPSNSSDIGSPGEMRFDNNYIYIYMGTTWTRIPRAIWS